jgi:hypothetical protein
MEKEQKITARIKALNKNREAYNTVKIKFKTQFSNKKITDLIKEITIDG